MGGEGGYVSKRPLELVGGVDCVVQAWGVQVQGGLAGRGLQAVCAQGGLQGGLL